jgi:cytochrome c-type biogenesis protein CcmE
MNVPKETGARRGRIRFLVGFAVVLAAVGLLVARGAKNAMVYYVDVSELKAKPVGADLEGLRVRGVVVPGTIDRRELVLRFEMTDGSETMPVTYRGVIPDTFGEDGEVVVEGTMTNAGFEADFLMAKCPSKYEAEMDAEGGGAPASKPA